MGRFSARHIALIIFGMNVVIIIIGLVASIRLSVDLVSDDGGFLLSWPFFSGLYGLFGVMILSRYPRHIIGWLFMFVSFLAAGTTMFPALEPFQAGDFPELIDILISLIGEATWIMALLIPMTLVLQFFPDGRLPSRRWWPVPLATVLGMAVMAVGFVPEAIGQAGNDEFIELLEYLNAPLIPLATIGSLAAVVVRFLRSQAAERAQMKWLVYTAGIGFLIGFLILLLLDEDDLFVSIYFTSLPSLLALAIGVAILRFRLYDIDIIIRRTLQYGLVTGLLALVYFGLVVTLQNLFAAVGDIRSEIFIVISTLVIAGLFNPLRQRVQEVVDRRFYRRTYDAEQALARFAAVARDEVDMDMLTAALLEVVEETMRPESIGLSLSSDKIIE